MKESWVELSERRKEIASARYHLDNVVSSMSHLEAVFQRYSSDAEALQIKDFLLQQKESLGRELKKMPVKLVYEGEYYRLVKSTNGQRVYKKFNQPLILKLGGVMWTDETGGAWDSPRYRYIYSSIEPLVEVKPEDATPVYED